MDTMVMTVSLKVSTINGYYGNKCEFKGKYSRIYSGKDCEFKGKYSRWITMVMIIS